MRIKTDDILAGGLVLLSIFLFYIALEFSPTPLLKLVGLTSAILIFISEVVYLAQKYLR